MSDKEEELLNLPRLAQQQISAVLNDYFMGIEKSLEETQPTKTNEIIAKILEALLNNNLQQQSADLLSRWPSFKDYQQEMKMVEIFLQGNVSILIDKINFFKGKTINHESVSHFVRKHYKQELKNRKKPNYRFKAPQSHPLPQNLITRLIQQRQATEELVNSPSSVSSDEAHPSWSRYHQQSIQTPTAIVEGSLARRSQDQSFSSSMEIVPVVENLQSSAETTDQPMSEELSADEQKKLAANLYNELADLVVQRINKFNKKGERRKHYAPFISSVNYFNGVYCTPLPLEDAEAMQDLINNVITKIDVTEETGQILCDSVKNFFIDFNAFFFKSYRANGFPDELTLLNIYNHASSTEFNFKIKNSDNYLRLSCLKETILSLSDKNHEATLTSRRVATRTNEIVTQTLVYNQAQVVINVKSERNEEEENWLGVLIEMGEQNESNIDTLTSTPADISVRLILVRGKSNQRLHSYYEVKYLKSDSAEYSVALSLWNKMDAQVKEILTGQNNANLNAILEYKLINVGQLHTLLSEINGHDYILPIFAVKKSRIALSSASEQKSTSPNQNQSRQKRPRKNKEQLTISEVRPFKRIKISQTQNESFKISSTVDKAPQVNSYSNLFEFLKDTQGRDVQIVLDIAEKNNRQLIQEFDFNKIAPLPLKSLEDSESQKLQEFLDSTQLYDHQKESVTTLVRAYNSNVGFGLFDEMSLGKTIQIGATLKYLIKSRPEKSYLVVVPLPVLTKWENELTEKLQFKSEDIITFYSKNRDISLDMLSSNKIILTTYNTLISVLKKHTQTPIKTALGYLSKYAFTGLDKKLIKKWLTLTPRLRDEIDANLVSVTKKGQRLKFLRLPTVNELQTLATTFELQQQDLKVLFTAELIFQFLTKHGFINKLGAILKPLKNITELDELYKNNRDLSMPQDSLFSNLQKIMAGFALQGIVFDEGHHGINDVGNSTFQLFQPIANTLANKGGLRIIATGTPFQNDIQELWTINEFLNPGSLLTKKEFMAAYENLLLSAGKVVCKAAALIDTNNLDQFSFAVTESVKTINKVYNQFQKMIEIMRHRQIRRTKASVNYSSGTFPQRSDTNQSWQLSEKQSELFNKYDKNAIEDACRGFSFFNSEEGASPSGYKIKKGYELLHNLTKIFDHPILIAEQHRNSLFDTKKRTIKSLMKSLKNIVTNEYAGDGKKFIDESAKLKKLIEIVTPLLENNNARILIATQFVPMAAIIFYALKITKPSIKPLVYMGGSSKEKREQIIKQFNEPGNDKDEQTPNVIIVSQKAGSEGIELYADTIVNYDQPWTYSSLQQLRSRAHRNTNPFKTLDCISLSGDNPLDKKIASFIAEKMEWATWFIDADPRCTKVWFAERLKNLLNTSILFSKLSIPATQIERTIAQIISKLELEQSLSLDQFQLNQIERVAQPVVADVQSEAPTLAQQGIDLNCDYSSDDAAEHTETIPAEQGIDLPVGDVHYQGLDLNRDDSEDDDNATEPENEIALDQVETDAEETKRSKAANALISLWDRDGMFKDSSYGQHQEQYPTEELADTPQYP